MEQTILEYGKLTDTHKLEAVDLFLEGFGHFLTFSKDQELKKKLLFEIFDPALFKCYLEGEKVLGLLGLATNELRPLNFKKESCIKYFGKFKGRLISSQMNAIFQKPVVKQKDELYIDVLVTGSEARRKGIGSALLNHAFSLEGYSTFYVEVFSNNQPAIKLYEKNGFSIEKCEKLSLMRFLGAGYPIKMVRKTH